MVQSQRQAAHQPFLLLKVKPGKLAVIFLCNAGCLEHIIAELLFTVCGIEHEESHKEHTLIPALQVLQDFLRLIAVGCEVRGDDVHVVPASDRLFLFLNGHLLQIGDFAFNRLDCLSLVNRLDVHGNNQAGFHIQKIGKHTVVEFGGEDLQEGHSAQLFPNAKISTITEHERGRSDKVLHGETARSKPVPFKMEVHLFVHVEHTVHECQPLFSV